MPPDRRVRNGGCWTCKLRRKKCDESRPICGDCNSLKIDCKYGSKPSWMDGGDRQRQKAFSLKEEIKRNAAQKREKAQALNKPTAHAVDHRVNVMSDFTIPRSSSNGQPTVLSDRNERISVSHSRTSNNDELTLMASLPWGHQQHHRSDTLERASANEMNFIMKYLDFIFPALFPHYQSHIFETGRTWLLQLLKKSKIAYHAILGLSCFYFTLALTDAERGAEHMSCKEMRWEEVDQESKRCFVSLRSDVQALDLSSRGTLTTALEKTTLMISITQVIIFEMTMGSFAPWQTHLPAALTLFEEVMASPEARLSHRGQPQSEFASVLLGIGDPLWTNPKPSNHIWSPDQAGFRFCAGLLIFIDVMASVTIRDTPRLLNYHTQILAEIDDGTPVVGDAGVQLSCIVGCHNWVIRSIADISVLDVWKREQIRSNDLSATELNNRAVNISYELDQFIDTTLSRLSSSGNATAFLVWAYAAKLYLSIVTDGWQPSAPKVRASVGEIIALLRTVAPVQMRTLAWPLCVAGCLAQRSEQHLFLGLIVHLPRTLKAGALDDAQHIMRKVWYPKMLLDASTWDLASCFAILGSPILLV
ncbi:hypothetical protein BU25DRAFT_346380 [Macroventuria anomochaeta]|uniref:Uncharacterized protein n=1 Tax=Macroventuria anomochaeta TaxID=301207 RepID=A0ACB6RWA5_9PLEO|nr:uncharacterized protein BU25DRAFT_346380 [Macroventuria anomochaeta]KAF2625418.1 hypothetical protein BU25DRAFT_346380 [Macroventuria anomochaeta]